MTSTARFHLPRAYVADSSGFPMAGAKLYFYTTGTTTPLATYSDAGLTTANANPVVANSAGVFGDIFLTAVQYKVVLKTSADVTVWTCDPVSATNFAIGGNGTLGTLASMDIGAGLADDGSGNLTLAPAGLDSATPATDDVFIFADTSDGDAPKQATIADLIATLTLPYRYRAGMIPSNSSGDVNNDITISPGACRNSDNSASITLAAAITKRLDASWSAGDGAGGLDTGSKAADTFYAILAILNPTSGDVDVLFTTSPTSPTLPSGYSKYRRIGWFRTDGSSNIRNCVYRGPAGEYVDYKTVVTNLSSGSVTTTGGSQTVTAPPNCIARLFGSVASGSGNPILNLSPLDCVDETPTGINSVASVSNATGVLHSFMAEVAVSAASAIRARCANATGTVNLGTRGWIDTGRDD